MTEPDLPAQLVARLERLATASPTVIRATVYDLLGDAGVDVGRLVEDARAEQRREVEDRIAATAAKLRLLEERTRGGRLTDSQHAVALRRMAALDVRLKGDRKEAARVLRRLEVRPAPVVSHAAPTPERLRHFGDEATVREREPDGTLLAQPRYELTWSVDRIGVALTAGEYTAATRLREAWARRQSSPRTVDLGGAGGGVPGSRVPVSDHQMAASREWNAIWHRLPPALRLIVMNFIAEVAPRDRSAPMTAIEFGQLYGQVRDKEAARGVTRGAIKTACALIEALWREYDQWRAEKARDEHREHRLDGQRRQRA
jgi:hypothetical protein